MTYQIYYFYLYSCWVVLIFRLDIEHGDNTTFHSCIMYAIYDNLKYEPA